MRGDYAYFMGKGAPSVDCPGPEVAPPLFLQYPTVSPIGTLLLPSGTIPLQTAAVPAPDRYSQGRI